MEKEDSEHHVEKQNKKHEIKQNQDQMKTHNVNLYILRRVVDSLIYLCFFIVCLVVGIC